MQTCAGDELELTFTSVANAGDIVAAIEAAVDTYGTAPTALFSNSNKTLTITLGADEAVSDATESTQPTLKMRLETPVQWYCRRVLDKELAMPVDGQFAP